MQDLVQMVFCTITIWNDVYFWELKCVFAKCLQFLTSLLKWKKYYFKPESTNHRELLSGFLNWIPILCTESMKRWNHLMAEVRNTDTSVVVGDIPGMIMWVGYTKTARGHGSWIHRDIWWWYRGIHRGGIWWQYRRGDTQRHLLIPWGYTEKFEVVWETYKEKSEVVWGGCTE